MTTEPESSPSDATTLMQLPASELQQLLDAITKAGYETWGPVVRDRALGLDRLTTVDQLPAGWQDAQAPGHYRLEHHDDPRYFAQGPGADSWKRLLFPERQLLVTLDRELNLIAPTPEAEPAPLALFGVRACDLAAIAVQSRVFATSHPNYQARLTPALIVGVHCQTAVATCFCPSMQTGPEFQDRNALDLLLTELCDELGHRFLLEAISPRARALVETLELSPASANARDLITEQLDVTRRRITTRMPDNVRSSLAAQAEHPHWEQIGTRCLGCANCTIVCPTCFCTTVEEQTDLTAAASERVLVWDSCFNAGHSHIHGGSVRRSTAARYRQWLTHKLSTWHDQFGTSGCVGCGRCSTWCPVGIDFVAEATTLSAAS